MKHRLRIWLIERLGGVEKPLPTTMPVIGVDYPATTGSTTYVYTAFPKGRQR